MLHDMPVGLVPGTAGLVPGLVPAGLCRHPPLLESSQPSRTSIVYGPSSAYIIRPVAAALSLTVATVSSPVVPVPPDSLATVPPDSVATASASMCLPTLRCFQNQPFQPLMQAKQDGGRRRMYGGCRFECTTKTGHFEKSLHLTHTLAARCPNAKFVHKNSLFHGNNYFSAAVLSVSL